MTFEMKSSGKKDEMPTGARRDDPTGKGRYDLLPCWMILRDALLYEKGAAHYGDRNWENGMKLGRWAASLLRHAFQLIEGHRDEDHAAAIRFNAAGFEDTYAKILAGKLPRVLDDLGIVPGGAEKSVTDLNSKPVETLSQPESVKELAKRQREKYYWSDGRCRPEWYKEMGWCYSPKSSYLDPGQYRDWQKGGCP